MKLSNIKIILRNFIYDFNDKFPNLGKPLFAMWDVFHKIKFTIKKIIVERGGHLNYGSDKLNVTKILWMDPQKIDFYINQNSLKSSESSSELKGDWDLSKKLIKDSLIYKTLKLKFIEGKNWREIKDYNTIVSNISQGKIEWGCNSKKELDDKLKEIKSLYNKIKNNINILKEILKSKNKKVILEKWKNIEKSEVGIDRNGQFIVIEGKYSILIAQLLNIPIIPVYITIRHKAWVDFKNKLYYFSTNYHDNRLYQRVTHPDLQNIPFKHGDIRFDIIKENISTFHGNLLDIGANLGYFSRKFEDEGFDCYAVEINRLYVYFLTKLKKAENRKYKIIPKSIFSYKINQELCFDIVLALNIFHHFLMRKNTYHNFINFLKRLKVKELYFEAHNPNEFLNKKVYRNYNPEQFVNFIIENSCLNKVKLLKKMNDGRSIYKLTAED